MFRRFDSKVRLLKGGEMMKTLVLVLVLSLLTGVAATAATVTVDTYADWNLVAAPLVPFNPAVDSVFSNFDVMFTAGITRWDAPSQGMIAYDAFDVPGAFGNVLLGDGYWFNYPEAGQIVYDGVPDGVPDASNVKTDMWISLPGNQLDGQDAGGWQLIGQPFNHDTPVDSGGFSGDLVFFTDGTTLKTWGEAADAGWVDSTMTFWDGATQGMLSLGYFFNDDDQFRAGHGYWCKTNKDNLAMIIPAN